MYVMFKLDLQEICSSWFTDGCDAENSVRLSKLSCGKNMIAAKEELYGAVPEVSSKRRTGWCGWKDTVSAPPGNRMMWMEGHCECATRKQDDVDGRTLWVRHPETGWCGWKDTVSAPPGNRMMWMEGHCECATRKQDDVDGRTLWVRHPEFVAHSLIQWEQEHGNTRAAPPDLLVHSVERRRPNKQTGC